MRCTGLMTLAALPMAFSLVLGAGPRDVRAAPEKPRVQLCGIFGKAKPCVNSTDVKDNTIRGHGKRNDHSRIGGSKDNLTRPVVSASRTYSQASIGLPVPGVVIVVATAVIESPGSKEGTVSCAIVPGKTAADRTPQAFFGSIDEKVKTASMSTTRGFEVKEGRFVARLECKLAGGSTVNLTPTLALHYVAKRY